MNEQLDPQVVTLAKAIRQTESGGDFKAKGKSGEFGGYQYTPDTWNGAAKKYGINVGIQDATPEQQNEVTYKRLKEWKDKGFNPGQIASMWNAGEGEPDAYTGKFSNGKPSTGKNSYGVDFNVPAYAKSVAGAYQKLKEGGQVSSDPSNPSSVAPKDGFVRTADIPQAPVPEEAKPQQGFLGTNTNDDLYGKIIDNSVTRGIRKVGDFLSFGGSEQLGKGIANQDLTDTAIGGLKTLGGIASVGGGGAILKGAQGVIKGINIVPKIFKGPGVVRALEAFKMTPKELASLSKTEQVNFLEEALKTGGENIPLTMKREFQHAIEKLLPGVDKEAGRAPGLLRKTGNAAWKGIKLATGLEGMRGFRDVRDVYEEFKK